jgi:CO/xanthine dehydrogenase Mo-binding subunit
VPTAAAIANAVADAIGAPMLQLPLTAERVLEAIQTRR